MGGTTAVDQGRLREAVELLESGYRTNLEIGEHQEAVNSLWRLGEALVLAGGAEDSAVALGCWQALRDEMGPTEPWITRRVAPTIEAARAQLGDEAFDRAWARGRSLRLEDAVARALDALR